MSQRACRVFISHSANAAEEPATLDFLRRLSAAIGAVDGFEPLADQSDLQPGDAWMQQLYTWMGLCDAAVILLSPRAVTRENAVWVPRETNLLLWRKSLDPRFVVIPVLIGGLKAGDLQSNPFLADVRLRDLQFADGLADDDKIPLIVQALKDKLATQRTHLAFDPMRTNVEDTLQRFAPPASIDHALLQHFGTDSWQPRVPPAQKLSLQLLRSAGSERVDKVIDSVVTGSQAEMSLGPKLFGCLYPLRLPAEAACRLMALCEQQAGRGSVLVNAQDGWVLRMLLRAASGRPQHDFERTWAILELPDGWGDDDLGEITRVLAEQLCETLLGTGTWELLSVQDDPLLRLQEQLDTLRQSLAEARQDRGAPVLVCAAYRDRWLDLARELVRVFPTVTFVFWTGQQLPAGALDPVAGAADAVPLQPSWPAGKDRAWQLNYRLKLQHFGGRSP